MLPKGLIKEAIKRAIDELNRLLIVLFIILFIVTIFIKIFILDILKFVLLGIIIFRIFSKDKQQRNKENKFYLKIINKIFKPFENIKRNITDKDHIYRKCFKCKTTLKLPLPSKIGILHAKCPKCKKRRTLITFRKEKIEIIKKSK